MIINPPIGSLCIGQGPVRFTVSDIPLNEDGSVPAIDWLWTVTPDGAAGPGITVIDEYTFEISASVQGAYVLKGTVVAN